MPTTEGISQAYDIYERNGGSIPVQPELATGRLGDWWLRKQYVNS